MDIFKYYLDGLFGTAPILKGTAELKSRLHQRMSEQYQTYLDRGLDKETAYNNVIESIGDVRKIIANLQEGAEKEFGINTKEIWGFDSEDRLSDKVGNMVRNFSDVASGLVMGIFNKNNSKDIHLVNKITVPLDGVEKIKINYLSESIVLKQSLDGALLVREFMNREEPELFAEVKQNSEEIQIRHGRRKGFFLQSRIEVYIPEDWKGTLIVSNISLDITSSCDWNLSSFIAKSVGGSIAVKSVIADSVKLFSSVGSLVTSYIAGNMDLNTSNGDIKVQKAEGSGVFGSNSGDIKINFDKVTGAVRLSSETGEIHLHISEESDFQLDAVSVTGGIFSPFVDGGDHPLQNRVHGTWGKFPYQDVEISTTTGNIFIYSDEAAQTP